MNRPHKFWTSFFSVNLLGAVVLAFIFKASFAAAIPPWLWVVCVVTYAGALHSTWLGRTDKLLFTRSTHKLLKCAGAMAALCYVSYLAMKPGQLGQQQDELSLLVTTIQSLLPFLCAFICIATNSLVWINVLVSRWLNPEQS